jgi:Septum formation initiator
VIAGLLLTRGPLVSYQSAHSQLADQRAQADLISQQNKALAEQIKGLGEASTLEDLARKDLSYARPGERVYTVQGVPDPPAKQPAERAPQPQRGPLESLASWLRGLF